MDRSSSYRPVKTSHSTTKLNNDSDMWEKVRCLSFNACDYIIKPLNIAYISRLITSKVNKSRNDIHAVTILENVGTSIGWSLSSHLLTENVGAVVNPIGGDDTDSKDTNYSY